MARRKLFSAGFQSPNFTMVPNDFFEIVPDMTDAELRVTIVMIRETFGYHRPDFRMGIKKMAAASGLSENGARTGAKAAEERGTFRRVNPGAQGSAEWELVVEHEVIEALASIEGGAASEGGGVQPVKGGGAASEVQSGSKESNKESKRNTTTTPDTKTNFALYEGNIGPLTPMIADAIKDAEKTYTAEWVSRAITEAAKSNVRNMKYIEGILQGYAKRGSPDIGRTFVKDTPQRNPQTTIPQAALVAQEWLRKKQEERNGN